MIPDEPLDRRTAGSVHRCCSLVPQLITIMEEGPLLCFDAWSRVGPHGTHKATAYAFPGAALVQGGDPCLRDLVARRKLAPQLATTVRAALRAHDTRRQSATATQ